MATDLNAMIIGNDNQMGPRPIARPVLEPEPDNPGLAYLDTIIPTPKPPQPDPGTGLLTPHPDSESAWTHLGDVYVESVGGTPTAELAENIASSNASYQSDYRELYGYPDMATAQQNQALYNHLYGETMQQQTQIAVEVIAGAAELAVTGGVAAVGHVDNAIDAVNAVDNLQDTANAVDNAHDAATVGNQADHLPATPTSHINDIQAPSTTPRTTASTTPKLPTTGEMMRDDLTFRAEFNSLLDMAEYDVQHGPISLGDAHAYEELASELLEGVVQKPENNFRPVAIDGISDPYIKPDGTFAISDPENFNHGVHVNVQLGGTNHHIPVDTSPLDDFTNIFNQVPSPWRTPNRRSGFSR